MTLRVYLDGRGLDVADGASALDVIRAADPAAAEGVMSGARAITDSRGLLAPPESPAYGGAIYRLVSARGHDTAPGSGL